MCGIVGIVASQDHWFERRELVEMQQSLLHRGPDGSGIRTWCSENTAVNSDHFRYGLAHTRLSILDLTDAALQPMQDESNQVSLVLNGEIYNYVELRSELAGLGYSFTSTGDTQVLLMAYLEWGSDCVKHLIGMYAFLVIDLNRRILFAARDPFGIKPLYFSNTIRGFALGSEIKSLRRLADVGTRSNPTSVLRYLRFGIAEQGAETMYSDIQQLEPGHCLSLQLDSLELRVRSHYQLQPSTISTEDLSFAQASNELRRLFLESLALHYRSDVPVGAALSGGIDSSSIVCGIRDIMGTSSEIQCFTYVARNSPLDEEPWATIATIAAGGTLHTTSPLSSDLLRDLPALVQGSDEPLFGTSYYAQNQVFKAARSAGVKVLLDGQGADEILGGYDRYLAARVATLLRQGDFRRARSVVMGARQKGKRIGSMAMQTLDCLALPRFRPSLRRLVGHELTPSWVDSEWFRDRQSELVLLDSSRGGDVLRDQLINDLQLASVPNLLRYEDRNSMAWSVESRVPFLVPSIVEFCLSMPESYLIDDTGQSKSILRRAMRGLVPDVLLDRQDKIGFAPPADDWMRESCQYITHELETTVVDRLPFINENRVRKLRSNALIAGGRSDKVWRLIFLSQWACEHDIDFI